MKFVYAAIHADSSGAAFLALMDRFGMYLAFSDGKGGQLRKRNTVMSYYRNVKNWLLNDFPLQRHAIEQQLLKIGRILERHCLKRQREGSVKKAPACTKKDLRFLMDGIYYDATESKDYQDASLLAIMWYAFRRAYDLAFVQKCNLALSSTNVLFIQLLRTKTSEEQGLSLFPDENSFITCPLHAIAMALATQEFPVASLLDLKQLSAVDDAISPNSSNIPSDLPLSDILLNCTAASSVDDRGESSAGKTSRRGSPALKMQGYVNSVVKAGATRQALAEITPNLSSHSFRRGGAQHATGNPNLAAQWIFVRGSWNMTATNKAFAYGFNTTSEDMMVSKLLSGWGPSDVPTNPSLDAFDSAVKEKMCAHRNLLFGSSLGFDDISLNFDKRVADLLTATLVRYCPAINDRYPTSPYASRMRTCLFSLSISLPELLSWSSALARNVTMSEPDEEDPFSREIQMINHQNLVITQLMEANREPALRNTVPEYQSKLRCCKSSDTPAEAPVRAISNAVNGDDTEKRKVRSASKTAAAIWYEWYTKTPRLWEECVDRQYKSQSKQIVATIKLFLPQGFKLDPSASSYANDVLREGTLAEANMLAFLRLEDVKRKFGSGLLKHLRRLHRSNTFKEHLIEYRILVATGKIVDPAP